MSQNVKYDDATRVRPVLAFFFDGFKFSSEENATNMLSNILTAIQGRNLPRLYILIDEYDNFSNQLLTTYKDSIYEKLTTGDSFFRNFFNF